MAHGRGELAELVLVQEELAEMCEVGAGGGGGWVGEAVVTGPQPLKTKEVTYLQHGEMN